MTSPAYRRNRVEDENRSDHDSSVSRVYMPGMSQDVQESRQDDQTSRVSSPSRTSNTLDSGSVKSTNITSHSGTPMSLTVAQRFDPPSSGYASEVRMSPSQGRISPERPDRAISPTKGMGGFVQSAMMKRSDSVQKRWSVQSPTGLSRGNSVASNQSSQDLTAGIVSGGISIGSARDVGASSGQNSPRALSRPTSSHSHATVTQERPSTASSMKSSLTASTNDGFVKPAVSHSETPNLNSKTARIEDLPPVVTTPPASPSKTDSRRWSPTKSSWLESALNKPDSPKLKTVPPPQQPAWMSELNKVKKGSVDLGRDSSTGVRHELNIGGLLRSPPPGSISKPSSLAGRPFGALSGSLATDSSDHNSSQDRQNTKINGEPADKASAKVLSYSATSPKPVMSKPETPPKKDFRSSLKSRQIPAGSGPSEPEFKNVFGQLRKTKTQNYVAPDQLKDNITRGKAALNITGGPKPSERKDEFKEAILKKKEDFKKAQLEGTGIKRSNVTSTHDSAMPEALAKRSAMKKLDPSSTAKEQVAVKSPPSRIIREGPPPSLPFKETSAPGRLQNKDTLPAKLAQRLNPALSGLLARGPPSVASDNSRSSSPSLAQNAANTLTTPHKTQSTEGGPQLTHITKGRARGPRRKAPSSALAPAVDLKPEQSIPDLLHTPVASTSPSKSFRLVDPPPPLKPGQPFERSSSPAENETPASQPSSPRKLDIKRRSQFLQEAPSKATQPEPQLDIPKPLLSAQKANPIEISVKLQEPSPKSSPRPISKAKPVAPLKSPSLVSPSSDRIPTAIDSAALTTGICQPPPPSEAVATTSPTKTVVPTPTKSKTSISETSNARFPSTSKQVVPTEPEAPKAIVPQPPPLSPSKLMAATSSSNFLASLETRSKESSAESSNSKVLSESNEDATITSPTSVKAAKAMWDRSATTELASTIRRAPSPIKLPTRDDENAALVAAGLRSPSPVKNLRSAALEKDSYKSTTLMQVPASPAESATLQSPAGRLPKSPLPQAAEASDQLAAFFGDRSPGQEYAADTTSILMARPSNGSNNKTLSSSLFLLSSNGRKTLVPSHQEHVLFEQNMYLCFHTFNNAAAKKTVEAYHWVGDDVALSNVKSIEALIQKEAKSAGAKLIKIVQGKETPELFQALGGIIIIRRGSANKYDSLAPHIVCGRQFFGQIAFDEVDYSPSSLCSGFPYLISTRSGQSYLWKGKGCGIDELSCARLIGMDFGLTGEVVEVEDGTEPASFLNIFGNGASIPKSADHWRMKAGYSKYCGRLFCADIAAKEQVSFSLPCS